MQTAEQVVAALTGGVVSTAVNIPAVSRRGHGGARAVPAALPAARPPRRRRSPSARRSTASRSSTSGRIAERDTRLLTIVGAQRRARRPHRGGRQPRQRAGARRGARHRGRPRRTRDAARATSPTSCASRSSRGDAAHARRRHDARPPPPPAPARGLGRSASTCRWTSGHLALFRYCDVPGMIGRVGTVFGEHGVNIDSAAVGRQPRRGRPPRRGRGDGGDDRRRRCRARSSTRSPPPTASWRVARSRLYGIAPVPTRVGWLRHRWSGSAMDARPPARARARRPATRAEEGRARLRLERRDRRRLDRARATRSRRRWASSSPSRASALQAPAVMLVAFVPMLLIASAYYYMNRADPDCGTTFSWVTRAMGPSLGLARRLGDHRRRRHRHGQPGADRGPLHVPAGRLAERGATRPLAVTAVGVVWIAVMTAICVIGIELSARTQVGLLGAEILTLALFAVVALVAGLRPATPARTRSTRASRGSTRSRSTRSSALVSGVLIAVFIYWGWDTTVTVNEETEDSDRGRRARRRCWRP